MCCWVDVHMHMCMYNVWEYINNYSGVSHISVYTVCILQVVHLFSPLCSFTADGILGINVAIASMRRGELSRFLVAPNYAFGVRGCPPRVPPNSTSEYTLYVYTLYAHHATYHQWSCSVCSPTVPVATHAHTSESSPIVKQWL